MAVWLAYRHFDVFAERPFTGNSLPVFLDGGELSAAQMLAVTQELRHFEAIFVTRGAVASHVHARIFDLVEELPFAGHPIIGAAVALHDADCAEREARWTFALAEKTVTVDTRRTAAGYFGLLDQGAAEFLGESAEREEVARAFGLAAEDLDPALPLAIVSTGLRYLIVPLRPGALGRARIAKDITALVQRAGAQFAVLFDEAAREIRHWNNDGIVEDVATGSAAGTIGAYRLRYCGSAAGVAFRLNQGRFVGRPSQLLVEPHGDRRRVGSVKVGGDVAIVGRGSIEVLPPAAQSEGRSLAARHGG